MNLSQYCGDQPELINFPPGRAEVSTQLSLSLPQLFDLPLSRHILSEKLQFISLQPGDLSLQDHQLLIVRITNQGLSIVRITNY